MNNFNFIIFSDKYGGFLTNNTIINPLFVASVDSAYTFRKKEAEKIAIRLSEDDYGTMRVLKKCMIIESC